MVRPVGTYDKLLPLTTAERHIMDHFLHAPFRNYRFGALQIVDVVRVDTPQVLYFRTGQKGRQGKAFFSCLSLPTFNRILAAGPFGDRFELFEEAISFFCNEYGIELEAMPNGVYRATTTLSLLIPHALLISTGSWTPYFIPIRSKDGRKVKGADMVKPLMQAYGLAGDFIEEEGLTDDTFGPEQFEAIWKLTEIDACNDACRKPLAKR